MDNTGSLTWIPRRLVRGDVAMESSNEWVSLESISAHTDHPLARKRRGLDAKAPFPSHQEGVGGQKQRPLRSTLTDFDDDDDDDGMEEVIVPEDGLGVLVSGMTSMKIGTHRNRGTSGLHEDNGEEVFDDPLRSVSGDDSFSENIAGFDPLSQVLSDGISSARVDEDIFDSSSLTKDNRSRLRSDGHTSQDMSFMPDWEPYKQDILHRFKTSKHIAISSKITDGDSQGASEGMAARSVDQTKARLEQLDLEATSAKEYFSQQEYIRHIELLHDELHRSWQNEDRVRALKIVIQCAKLLHETSTPQFYPSMFVLVTSVLDTFGTLVYNRIYQKSMDRSPDASVATTSLNLFLGKDDFSYDEVDPEARETCNNWFYKIASIRELLPRFFVELSVMKCLRFVQPKDAYSREFMRLAKSTRGIGHPLVSVYARAYLAKKAMELNPTDSSYLSLLFFDIIESSSQQLSSPSILRDMQESQLNYVSYIQLFEPAADWVLKCLSSAGPRGTFASVLSEYKAKSTVAIFLRSIISSFQATEVSSYAREIAGIVEACDQTLPRVDLYIALGEKISDVPPSDVGIRRPLLNVSWRAVQASEDVELYARGASIFVKFVVRCFGPNEINLLLGDVRGHIKKDHGNDKVDKYLFSLGHCILQSGLSFSSLFSMNNFFPVVALLSGDTRKELSKQILLSFFQQQLAAKKTGSALDMLVVSSMLETAKSLHDSLTSLSSVDDIRDVTTLLIQFVRHVDFDVQLQKQLDFYVDCRRYFTNLDAVVSELCLLTTSLAMRARSTVRGRHTKSSIAFVKACIAYLHITIPSISDSLVRLRLLTIAGEVALANHLLPQADTLFRIAVTSVGEIPPFTEDEISHTIHSNSSRLVNLFARLSSALILVPSDPSKGPLYLFRGLFNVVKELSWDDDELCKIELYTNLLASLNQFQYDSLPYHIRGVESNDTLYMGNSVIREEASSLSSSILQSALQTTTRMHGSPDVSIKRKLSVLVVRLIDVIVRFVFPHPSVAPVLSILSSIAMDCSQPSSLNPDAHRQRSFLEKTFARFPAEEREVLGL